MSSKSTKLSSSFLASTREISQIWTLFNLVEMLQESVSAQSFLIKTNDFQNLNYNLLWSYDEKWQNYGVSKHETDRFWTFQSSISNWQMKYTKPRHCPPPPPSRNKIEIMPPKPTKFVLPGFNHFLPKLQLTLVFFKTAMPFLYKLLIRLYLLWHVWKSLFIACLCFL
jgi:hypothetical protein